MAEPSPARECSKLLFGTEHMLTVASHICETDPLLTVASVGEATDVPQTTVHRLVHTLTAVGVLARLPRNDGDRTQWYSRRGHPFWEAVRAFTQDEAHGQPGSQDDRVLPRHASGTSRSATRWGASCVTADVGGAARREDWT